MIIFVLTITEKLTIYDFILDFALAKLKCKSTDQGDNVEAIVYVNTISIIGCNQC